MTRYHAVFRDEPTYQQLRDQLREAQEQRDKLLAALDWKLSWPDGALPTDGCDLAAEVELVISAWRAERDAARDDCVGLKTVYTVPRVDLSQYPPEVREVCEAASGVWIGRYQTRSGPQRNREWRRLADALEAVGLRHVCPTCYRPLDAARKANEQWGV